MKQNKLLPAYLVVGEDQLKRETAVSRLKARVDDGFAAFNIDERTAAPDLNPTDVAISLNTLPVGSGFRLVLVHDANRLPKAVSETIISYLENPNPECVLCLVATALAANTRLYKAVARVGKSSVIKCAPLSARELPAYVIKHAAAKGLVIDASAARELISRVGEDTVMLDRQLDTLKDTCQNAGRITLADVESCVARTAEVKPWEFLDAVSAGNATRALELYRHMQNPSHLALLSLLTRRVRELICARSLIDRGNAAGVAKELGRQAWQVRSVVQSARRFTPERLSQCLAKCAECERALKSGSDAQTSFVDLVIYISRR